MFLKSQKPFKHACVFSIVGIRISDFKKEILNLQPPPHMGQAVRTKLWPHHFFNHWPRRRRAEASTTSGSTTMRAKLPQSLIQHYQPASTIGLPYVDSLLAFMIALDDKEEEEDDKEEEMK